MAAKFVIIALAFCSASANVCMPIFPPKDGCQVPFPEVFSGPSVSVAGPRFLPAPAISSPRIVSGPTITVGGPSPIVSVPSSNFAFPQEFPDPASEIAPGSFSTGPNAMSHNIPVLQAPPVTLNPVEGPIIPLPSPVIPGPQVIRHKCYCTKTVVRPQLIQRTINVPRIQRYLKRSYRPVVENVAYTAKPVGGESQGEGIVIGAGPAGGAFVSGGVVPSLAAGGIVSGIAAGGPLVETSETTCEQVVPSFPRCY